MSKYPDIAFGALDFTGKGYITANDVSNHALVYSTPLSKPELKEYCEKHVFKGSQAHMSADQFRNFFYPDAKRTQRQVDSEDEDEAIDSRRRGQIDSSRMSQPRKAPQSLANSKYAALPPADDGIPSNRNANSGHKHAAMMKAMQDLENNLKQKLQSNYNNVRKAFLDLDKDHDCFVSAEELANVLRYGVKPRDPRS